LNHGKEGKEEGQEEGLEEEVTFFPDRSRDVRCSRTAAAEPEPG
jgi:hypothetical protein